MNHPRLTASRSLRARLGALGLLAIGCTLCACGGDEPAEPGLLSVLLEAEEVITDGIEPGPDLENIADGFHVRFSAYIVSIGELDLHHAREDHSAENADVFVVDLTQVPAAGLSLWEVQALQAGRWELSYHTRGAADDAQRHDSVSPADFERMRDEDLTYLIRGTLEKPDGRSCPPAALAQPHAGSHALAQNHGGDDCYANPNIAFELPARAETSFGPCEVDGLSGVSIPGGGTQTAALTIHGDHIFFNGFPESAETGTARYAQWLADCDLDLDGVVTQRELEQIAPSELPELDERFALGGSPITPLDTMWTYVRAQLKTQGHFQGEGECPIDGAAHDHD